MAGEVCAECGALRAQGASHCQSCGAPFPPVAPPAPPPPSAYPYAPCGTPYAAPYSSPYLQPWGWAAPYYPAPFPPPFVFLPTAAVMPLTREQRIGGMAASARGARTGAAGIDVMILGVVWALLFFFVYPAVFHEQFGLGLLFSPSLPYRVSITAFVIFLYYGLGDGFGGSVGKRALGLTIVDVELRRIGVMAGLARACEVFLWMFCLLIGIIGLAVGALVQSRFIHKNGQGIGDRFARGWVVRSSALANVG